MIWPKNTIKRAKAGHFHPFAIPHYPLTTSFLYYSRIRKFTIFEPGRAERPSQAKSFGAFPKFWPFPKFSPIKVFPDFDPLTPKIDQNGHFSPILTIFTISDVRIDTCPRIFELGTSHFGCRLEMRALED